MFDVVANRRRRRYRWAYGAALLGYGAWYAYNRWSINTVPVPVEESAKEILRALDEGVEDEIDDSDQDGAIVAEPVAEAARMIRYGAMGGVSRWKTRHYSMAVKASIALKEKFGLRKNTEANRLMGDKWVRKWLSEQGLRPSHIVSTYLTAVEMWLTACSDELAAIQMGNSRVIQQRRREAAGQWVAGWPKTLSEIGSVLSGSSRLSEAGSLSSE
jgi:hypothetical protein